MRSTLVAVGAAAALSGCLSYSPQQFSAMSSYDLCDLQHYQRMNFTAAGRAALDAELKRRNESCRGLIAQIERDHADDEYDRMNNRQSP